MIQKLLDNCGNRLLQRVNRLWCSLQCHLFFMPLKKVRNYFFLQGKDGFVNLLVHDPRCIVAARDQSRDHVTVVQNAVCLQIVVFPKLLTTGSVLTTKIPKHTSCTSTLQTGVNSIGYFLQRFSTPAI